MLDEINRQVGDQHYIEETIRGVSKKFTHVGRILDILADFVEREDVSLVRDTSGHIVVSYGGELPEDMGAILEPHQHTKYATSETFDEYLGIILSKETPRTKVGQGLVATRPIQVELMNDAYSSIECEDYRICLVLMSRRSYADFRKFGRDSIDEEMRSWLVEKGLVAKLWGSYIMVSTKAPDEKILLLGERTNVESPGETDWIVYELRVEGD